MVRHQSISMYMWLVLMTGLTPLGTSLDQKILQPLLLGPARANQLQKPLLVIAITDGTFLQVFCGFADAQARPLERTQTSVRAQAHSECPSDDSLASNLVREPRAAEHSV